VINELLVFLICDEEENYFVMEAVLNCIGRVLQQTIKEQWSGKVVYDNLDSIILVADEIIDEGLIVCLDPAIVLDRMKMRDSTG
jgi:hypothetical protein